MDIIKSIFRTIFGLIIWAFIGGYLLGSYFGTIKTLDRDKEFDLWRFPAYLMAHIIEDDEKYIENWYYGDLYDKNKFKAEQERKQFIK